MLHKCNSPPSFVLEMNTVNFLSSINCPGAILAGNPIRLLQESQSTCRLFSSFFYENPLEEHWLDIKRIPSHTKGVKNIDKNITH